MRNLFEELGLLGEPSIMRRRAVVASALPADGMTSKHGAFEAVVKRVKAELPKVGAFTIKMDQSQLRWLFRLSMLPPNEILQRPSYIPAGWWNKLRAQRPGEIHPFGREDGKRVRKGKDAAPPSPPPPDDNPVLLIQPPPQPARANLASIFATIGQQLDDYFEHVEQTLIEHIEKLSHSNGNGNGSTTAPSAALPLPPELEAINAHAKGTPYHERHVLPRSMVGGKVPWQIGYTKNFEKSVERLPSGLHQMLNNAIKRFARDPLQEDTGLHTRFFGSHTAPGAQFQRTFGRDACIAGMFSVTRRWRVIVNRDSERRIYWMEQIINRGDKELGWTERGR